MIRIYRRAIADADLAIAASGWAVLFWRLIQREMLTRISGLALSKPCSKRRRRVFLKTFFCFAKNAVRSSSD
jgi:hypothetical protein